MEPGPSAPKLAPRLPVTVAEAPTPLVSSITVSVGASDGSTSWIATVRTALARLPSPSATV